MASSTSKLTSSPRWLSVFLLIASPGLGGACQATSSTGGSDAAKDTGAGGTSGAGGAGGGSSAGGAGGGGTGGVGGGGTGGAGGSGTGGTGGAEAGQPMDAGDSRPDGDGSAPTADTGADGGDAAPLPRFSFFVTSLESMRELSKSQDGFGGDLRFGEATGLTGADKICKTIAEKAMPVAGQKTWRAFLSATTGGGAGGTAAVHAIERVGSGPWYDRNGKLIAMNVAGLSSGNRPMGDAAVVNDLPNERGEPNHQGVDNHDTLTGSNMTGRFQGGSLANTCNDWTSSAAMLGRPTLGHSWPASSGMSWIRAHQASGCKALVNLLQNGPGAPGCDGVGCGGGYGGIYCFALTP